jgi:hypothetical protein
MTLEQTVGALVQIEQARKFNADEVGRLRDFYLAWSMPSGPDGRTGEQIKLAQAFWEDPAIHCRSAIAFQINDKIFEPITH